MKVCILVPTYKRNHLLKPLLNQLHYQIERCALGITFAIVVADSDPLNPIRAELSTMPKTIYRVNQGNGFDDNLYHCYAWLLHECDYIFSISDDDLLFPSDFPALRILCATLPLGNDVYLFNHTEFSVLPDGGMKLLGRHYGDQSLCFDKDYLLRYFLKVPPRHAGIIYKTSFLNRMFPRLSAFRGTQHLYAAPLIFGALEGSVVFVDLSLMLFHRPSEHVDGAWEDHEKVFFGLIQFLNALRPYLSPDQYKICRDGYYENYFGEGSYLRSILTRCKVALPVENQIEHLLF